jgi:hypothetical protein
MVDENVAAGGMIFRETTALQVYLNAFTSLSGYGQSDCGCSHLEMSKYIYVC